MSDTTDKPAGYFIDWDGKMRPTDQPGKDLRCEIDYKAKYVMVFNKYGGLDHESTWYADEAAVTKAGIKVAHADLSEPIRISSIE